MKTTYSIQYKRNKIKAKKSPKIFLNIKFYLFITNEYLNTNMHGERVLGSRDGGMEQRSTDVSVKALAYEGKIKLWWGL